MPAYRPSRRDRDALPRRTFLRAAGVGVALPWLSAMGSPARAAEARPTAPDDPELHPQDGPPRRFVAVTMGLGLLAEHLYPADRAATGRGYVLPRYLKPLADLRDDLTLVGGASHPGVRGGHQAEASLLTCNPAGANGRGRNTASLDQYLAKHLGGATRFPSLAVSNGSTETPCYTDGGAMLTAENSPRRVFDDLFVDPSPAARRAQSARAAHGRSVMDLVREDAKRLGGEVGPADRRRLDEYFTGVRELERRMAVEQAWADRPKPKVAAEPPDDVRDAADFVGRQRLMARVLKLALETDSARYIVHHLSHSNRTAPIPGVDTGWHSLSHHGKEEAKLAQLALVEGEIVAAWGEFLRSLAEVDEHGRSLLDSTAVLLTSNLGNASNHDNRNMPVVLAGGGFRHGQYLQFDANDNAPLPKLYTAVLHRHGVAADRFYGEPGTLRGIELA